MSNPQNISVAQLQRAITIRERMDSLQAELEHILGGEKVVVSLLKRGRRKMSAAGRRKIADAQKLRWAKMKGDKPERLVTKKRRKMSPAAKAKMAAAAKARWAKVKAAGKSRL